MRKPKRVAKVMGVPELAQVWRQIQYLVGGYRVWVIGGECNTEGDRGLAERALTQVEADLRAFLEHYLELFDVKYNP